MNRKQVNKLFAKYLNDECSPEEVELLHKFLKSFQGENNDWSESKYGSKKELTDKMLLVIKSKIKEKNIETVKTSKRNSIRYYMRYAAILVAIIGSAAFYYQSNTAQKNIIISDDAIVLKMGNNEIKEIDASSGQAIVNKNGEVIGNQQGTQLSYVDNTAKETVFNEIFVPNGKRFQLILSDGTLVHLNAGSSLKYPINFISGRDRQVFLEGEAYFEVTKNEAHPFIVNAGEMGVRVLGTHFNVSSYAGSKPFTVLVEGSVGVYKNNASKKDDISKIIMPGQKALFIGKEIQIDEVNVANYLGWREGNMIFIDVAFNEIIQKIERKYNVVIENKFEELNTIQFKGRFEDESIIDLLDVFKESVGFEYQVLNNKIIITKP